MDHPFVAGGPTFFVTNAAVQIPPGVGASFRVVNLAAVGTPQYLAWGPTNAVTVTAPTAGNPQPNTLGMLGGTERVITIPNQGQFFIASAATGFLITQGDGV